METTTATPAAPAVLHSRERWLLFLIMTLALNLGALVLFPGTGGTANDYNR